MKKRLMILCALFLVSASLIAGKSTTKTAVNATMEADHIFFQPTGEFASYQVTIVGPNGRYEYHFEDERAGDEEAALHSQIPPGYVGAPSDLDDSRADALRLLVERADVARVVVVIDDLVAVSHSCMRLLGKFGPE